MSNVTITIQIAADLAGRIDQSAARDGFDSTDSWIRSALAAATYRSVTGRSITTRAPRDPS
jgi:hypothetical protein